MGMFVIFSRFSSQAFREPDEINQLAATVKEKIAAQCPGVDWKESYAVTGRFDVVDLVESDSPAQVEKAALLIQGYGHAHTEVSRATPWKEFLASL